MFDSRIWHEINKNLKLILQFKFWWVSFIIYKFCAIYNKFYFHLDLEEENRKLKEARLCKICLDQELGVVMLPCAHLVACITCASSLPDCPLCRQTIKATVRTFLS